MKKQRSPFLSTRQDWISIEIFMLFVATIIYAVVVWQYESGKTQETMAAVLTTMRHVSTAILPMIVGIAGSFEIIGEIMIRFTNLMEKVKAEGKAEGKVEGKAEGKAEGIAEGKAEGIAEGKVQGRAETIEQFREYFAWEKRRDEAAANNEPFSEPPPPKPEGYPEA